VLSRREAAHVGPDLGEQHLGDASADAGDRVEQRDLFRVRRKACSDLSAQTGDSLVQIVDVAQVFSDHEAMVLTHAPRARLFALIARGAHASAREVRQAAGVGLAGDTGVEHVPRRRAPDVRGDASEFDVRVFKDLLHTVHDACLLSDEATAVAGQVAQRARGRRGDEAGPQQPMPQQAGDPGRVSG